MSRTVETENLQPGMVVRQTFNDDVTGTWVEYVETVEVIEVHHDEARDKYLPWTGRVLTTTHPTAEVGRVVTEGEARYYGDNEVIAEGPAPKVTVTWTVYQGLDNADEQSETIDPRSPEAIDLLAGIVEDETMRPDAIEGTPSEIALLRATFAQHHATAHLDGWREQAV